MLNHAQDILAQLLLPDVESITDSVLGCLLGRDVDPLRPEPPTPPAVAHLFAQLERYDYDRVLDHLSVFARSLEDEVAAQSELAVAVWRELEPHPQARRLILVRHRRRLHSWGLFNLLLESSRRLAPAYPREACRRAELALELVGNLPHPWLSQVHIEDLRASALRALANTQYLLGEIAAATETLRRAGEALRLGTEDLLERAHLLCLRSRLAAVEGNWQEAVRVLGPARAIYQRFGETDLEARALVEQAELVGHRNPTLGTGLLRDALELIDPERDPRAALSARHQLAWFTNDRGRPEEALLLLSEARPLYQRFPDAAVSLQRRWLEGRVCRKLDLLEDAERNLGVAARGFEELGIVADLILCGLDLLELYAHVRRPAELARLELDTRRRFAAWGLSDEALAAWTLAAESAGDRGAVSLFRGQLPRFLGSADPRPEE